MENLTTSICINFISTPLSKIYLVCCLTGNNVVWKFYGKCFHLKNIQLRHNNNNSPFCSVFFCVKVWKQILLPATCKLRNMGAPLKKLLVMFFCSFFHWCRKGSWLKREEGLIIVEFFLVLQSKTVKWTSFGQTWCIGSDVQIILWLLIETL